MLVVLFGSHHHCRRRHHHHHQQQEDQVASSVASAPWPGAKNLRSVATDHHPDDGGHKSSSSESSSPQWMREIQAKRASAAPGKVKPITTVEVDASERAEPEWISKVKRMCACQCIYHQSVSEQRYKILVIHCSDDAN
jgi:hypothetical protein